MPLTWAPIGQQAEPGLGSSIALEETELRLAKPWIDWTASFHDNGDSHARGSALSAAPDAIPGDATSTATVAVGGHVKGAIDTAGDHDWYQVSLVSGQTYTFSTMFSTDLFDTVLRLRDANGVQIAENDDANFDNGLHLSEITFTATSTGTYFLDVAGYQNDTGGFTLSVTAPVADAVSGSAATLASLVSGSTANGTLDQTGDHDWYAIHHRTDRRR
jgi:serralysin